MITTHTEEETSAYAQKFAAQIKAGDIVAMHGDLGMGKSVFCRSVIRTLCDDTALVVPSPTFTLVQIYDCAQTPVWHFDLYRLSDPDEVYELGWEEALADGIILIEWPERLGGLLPSSCINVTLSGTSEAPNQRTIEIMRS